MVVVVVLQGEDRAILGCHRPLRGLIALHLRRHTDGVEAGDELHPAVLLIVFDHEGP